MYFPKLKQGYEVQKNKIQLYSRQVFVTDSVEEIVPEFLQDEANPTDLTTAAIALLTDPQAQHTMRQNYERMRHIVGTKGVCDRAAQGILEMLLGRP